MESITLNILNNDNKIVLIKIDHDEKKSIIINTKIDLFMLIPQMLRSLISN